MLKTFALVLSLSAALTVAGCSSTSSSGTSGYSPELAKKNTGEARRTVRSAKRDAAKAERTVAKLERRIARDTKRLKGKASAKRKAQARARLKKNTIALRKAKRAARSEKRDLRLANRKLERAERLVRRAKSNADRAQRVATLREERNAAREARRVERSSGEGTAGRRSSWLQRGLGGGGIRKVFGGGDPAYAFASDYRARSDGGWKLPAIPVETMPKRLLRQQVRYRTSHKTGTIVVDTGSRFLYLVQGGGKAMRYGIGVGRQGFAWSGKAHIGWKQKWPKWTPPKEMIAREPKLAKYCADCGGMPGGISNPLGARALYLHANGKDTLFRLHGTPNWKSIGTAQSSGCIRMINQDVIDLYERARTGAQVVVM